MSKTTIECKENYKCTIITYRYLNIIVYVTILSTV